MQIRAVHIEITNSLEKSEFLKAFYRFKARRGCPTIIRSDNAKTFKAASMSLALKFGVQWKFNTELAPWTGGIWERVIRTIKTSLRIVISNYRKSNIDFSTCLCQIEEVINRRPITYCNGNDNDVLPLTPWNFLIISHSDRSINSIHNNSSLVQSFLENNAVVRSFWKRWKQEYLPSLIVNKSKADLKHSKIGDVVLLSEASKREYWSLAKIIRIQSGRDKLIYYIQPFIMHFL